MKKADNPIQRVEQLQNTCTELLETLTITLTFIKKYTQEHNIPVPEPEKLSYFLHKASVLLDTCSIDTVKFPIRRIFTEEKSDKDFTEPNR